MKKAKFPNVELYLTDYPWGHPEWPERKDLFEVEFYYNSEAAGRLTFAYDTIAEEAMIYRWEMDADIVPEDMIEFWEERMFTLLNRHGSDTKTIEWHEGSSPLVIESL